MRHLLTLLLFSLCISKKTSAQFITVDSLTGDTVYRFISMENPPQYPGGFDKFKSFIESKVSYPKKSFRRNKVNLKLKIEKDGRLWGSPSFIGTSTETLRKEVLNALNLMPRWNPGLGSGKPMIAEYLITIEPYLKEGIGHIRILKITTVDGKEMIRKW